MKKAFITVLISTQIVIILGMSLIVGLQWRNQDQVGQELKALHALTSNQEAVIRDLTQGRLDVSRRIDDHSADIKVMADEIGKLGGSEDGKVGNIALSVAESPVLQPLRWAYVDKFKLMRMLKRPADASAATAKQKGEAAKETEELITRAIRTFAEGKFDLMVDKTFGDNHIYYRSSRPALDVTDAIGELMLSMAPAATKPER